MISLNKIYVDMMILKCVFKEKNNFKKLKSMFKVNKKIFKNIYIMKLTK